MFILIRFSASCTYVFCQHLIIICNTELFDENYAFENNYVYESNVTTFGNIIYYNLCTNFTTSSVYNKLKEIKKKCRSL